MTTYRDKRGRVRWSDLFAIDPSFKEWKLGSLSDAETRAFLRPSAVPPGLEAMTASDYFDACLLCYEANREEKRWDGTPAFEIAGLSAKQAYERNADGRDEGLTSLPEDDPSAFKHWLLHRESWGGHPWEIMRGGNSTHVNLGVTFEAGSGYHYWLAGKNRIAEVVRSANALERAGLPVIVDQRDVIDGVVSGEGFVYIVPNGTVPRYCWYLFPGERTEYYINIPTDFTRSQTMKLIHRAHWYPDQAVEDLVAEGDRLHAAAHPATS
ncbi:MAG: hypothetical protein LBK95_16070 [Bifidobacteriaceae bacterium]|jgi:hypothetical protein|nr:hypothetical protein [Bifidobacteriaceae bacterium]